MALPFHMQQIQGRLVRDPELKTTPSGKTVAVFDLAYLGRYKTDAQGSLVSFLKVEAWEKQAEYVAKNLRKGMEVIVKGDLVQRRWQRADGKKASDFRLVMRGVLVCEPPQNWQAVLGESPEAA
ncbi:MAG: single-stranded DNA-binding protein [Leptospiraceae bacterium]|nr:single-stranded DNA-binding protein [Leptospiraceae bacterium]MDW8306273.1 single-stranded DNA-binding protein [Leptospiraceae bacterium]